MEPVTTSGTSVGKTSEPIQKADEITSVAPSTSNDPQLPRAIKSQRIKQQRVKKTLSEKSTGKQYKSDLEMQPISRPLTPVAQAVTDRLYNGDKIDLKVDL